MHIIGHFVPGPTSWFVGHFILKYSFLVSGSHPRAPAGFVIVGGTGVGPHFLNYRKSEIKFNFLTAVDKQSFCL